MRAGRSGDKRPIVEPSRESSQASTNCEADEVDLARIQDVGRHLSHMTSQLFRGTRRSESATRDWSGLEIYDWPVTTYTTYTEPCHLHGLRFQDCEWAASLSRQDRLYSQLLQDTCSLARQLQAVLVCSPASQANPIRTLVATLAFSVDPAPHVSVRVTRFVQSR
jgi:hypothetical protein